ncbi:MAG TPA: HAD hydrolase family protein [Clostridia bacterium]|nr:HAD hydrolase family protein [Clostridia bacterium]
MEWVTESPAHAQKGLDALRTFAREIDVNRNHHLINLVPKGHGKGVALQGFAERLGVALEEVVAIGAAGTLAVGDSLNDLSMIDGRFGLRGGAVANADAIVRAAVERAGGCVASRRASYGVLEIIDRYVPSHAIQEGSE